MIVISDTSPLRYLALLGLTSLLPRLYGEIICPERVRAECCHPNAPESLRQMMLHPPEWLRIEPDPPVPPDLAAILDPGEASAIVLALQTPGSLLLIDERKGRRLAENRGLLAAGTINVLADAGVKGLIDFHATIDSLRKQTNFRVSDAVIEQAWAAAQA